MAGKAYSRMQVSLIFLPSDSLFLLYAAPQPVKPGCMAIFPKTLTIIAHFPQLLNP